MRPNVVAYLAVMSAVTLGTRILPLTLIRKPIENRFLRSFLYYVPYVTLAVMTFPAILQATDTPAAVCWMQPTPCRALPRRGNAVKADGGHVGRVDQPVEERADGADGLAVLLL
jgi:branched-subunit amino acid transport protein